MGGIWSEGEGEIILFKAEIKDNFSFKSVNKTKKRQSYAWRSSTGKSDFLKKFCLYFRPSPKVKINLISGSLRADPYSHVWQVCCTRSLQHFKGIYGQLHQCPMLLHQHSSIFVLLFFQFPARLKCIWIKCPTKLFWYVRYLRARFVMPCN